MPFARARDGLSIHYRSAGTAGPWVVLIQGLTLSGRFWFDIPERVAELGARVLWLDNRGTGQSDPFARATRMGTLADDVIAVLDDAGAERATVVGISMGGMIAQHVALRHRARVEGLVLLATTPGLPHGKLPSPGTLATLVELPFRQGTPRGAELSSRLLLPDAERHRFGELFARWPGALNADPQRRSTFFYQLGAIASHSTGSKLPTLTVPTVVITGTEDRLVPPESSRAIARLIPGAELEELEGVGHAIPALDQTVVERAVRRVWERAGRGA
jgi:pimeloyl-ACP methyl ester carboxylesterase